MRSAELSEATWRKSSRSNPAGGACVEVAKMPRETAVRDAKDPAVRILVFGNAAFDAFLTGIKTGRFES